MLSSAPRKVGLFIRLDTLQADDSFAWSSGVATLCPRQPTTDYFYKTSELGDANAHDQCPNQSLLTAIIAVTFQVGHSHSLWHLSSHCYNYIAFMT